MKVARPHSPPSLRIHSEGGAIIPIVAVMSLALIATLTILGIETSRVKSAATKLRGVNERICKNVAQKAVLPNEAVELFSNEIKQLIPIEPFVKITAARLVLPFPLDEQGELDGIFYDFQFPEDTCEGGVEAFRPPNTGSASPIPFAQLSPLLGCSNSAAAPTLSDCELEHRICDQSGNPHPNYPRSMWSEIYNAGNTVGCELTAEVENVLSLGATTRLITAKAAWSIPVRARSPFLEDRNLTLVPSSFAGLSLGIATQMTTWAGAWGTGTQSGYDDRFNFVAYDAALNELNPRRNPSPGANPQRLTFLLSNNLNLAGNISISYPPLYGLNPAPRIPPTFALLGVGPTPTRASEEFLAACINPLVVIRNVIGATLVELAARHGQLRNLTQVASINPRHKGGVWADEPNRPVEIVPFGRDLTAERYQHPFVTYYSDPTETSAVQTLGGDQEGFLLPWAAPNDSPRYHSNSQRLQRQTLLTQQLRYCLHLWDNDLVRRPSLFVHTDITRFLPSEFRFLTSLQDPSNTVVPDSFFYGTWDYGDPWGALTANTGNVSRLLTAAEVVQSLGTSQLCPAPEPPDGVINCKANNFDPAQDLEPDLKGYLLSQLTQTNSAEARLQPYPSPGLFHPVDPSNSAVSTENQINPTQPMFLDTTEAVNPARSVVTIITTKGFKEAPSTSYHQDLKARVSELNQAGRPVIIVFIPATGADSNTTPNYCELLRRGNDCASPESGAEDNRLFLLSPYAVQYGNTYTNGTEAQAFISYWEDLLIDDGTPQDLFAPFVGEAIFSDAIVGLRPKL